MSTFAMRSILIAYEDQYYERLHLFIKALRQDRGLPGICLEGRSVRGSGGFIGEVPRLLRTPLKQTRRPPDRVVCLADADRPRNLTPDAPATPTDIKALDTWVLELEKRWLDFLVRGARLDDTSSARLRVNCLRWNKESLLVASPDALLDHAAQQGRRDQVAAILRACDPCPTTLGDSGFMSSFKKPDDCMDRVIRAVADRRYKKGRDDDDLLRTWITPNDARRGQLLSRCPDLARLLCELR